MNGIHFAIMRGLAEELGWEWHDDYNARDPYDTSLGHHIYPDICKWSTGPCHEDIVFFSIKGDELSLHNCDRVTDIMAGIAEVIKFDLNDPKLVENLRSSLSGYGE